ncbi:hypothetical protein LAZ67_22000695 [Cordylochernes scorpioides]|uniref:Transposase n=1 Tax=Cordylochernes scorpioides TaxID=51811 RepID=A0ABY6LND6_9ARAC|nr:hypothetical protein LAZ67_22000695 [Cordylochernes scorpioides]
MLARMTSVLGNYWPHRTTIFRWYREFQRGKYGIRDAPWSGRPTSLVNVEIAAVQKLLETDRHITYHQIEESLYILAPEVHFILHDHLKLSKVMKLGFIILMCLLKPRTRYGSLKVKACLCLYGNPDPLRRKAIKKLRRSSRTDTWLFHHDNASAHHSKICADYLARTGPKLLENPPYSPDLAPFDFAFFPHDDAQSYEVEIDVDELLDIERDPDKRLWLRNKLKNAKQSPDHVERFPLYRRINQNEFSFVILEGSLGFDTAVESWSQSLKM